MRLVTYRFRGVSSAGAMIDDTQLVDLQRADPALPNTVRALLAGGAEALDRARAAIDSARHLVDADPDGARAQGLLFALDEPGLTLGPPIPDPDKALAIGLNYRLHAEETGATLPEYPIIFTKLPNTFGGVGDPIQVPSASTRVDWEGEFCVVIGRRGRHISRDEALDYVAGYMNGNDVSVRDYQRHAATWTAGKNFDTHGPTGPWILTADEAPAPDDFMLRTYVNDVLKQESSTGDLIFDVPALIEYASTVMTLEPGDFIFTGTPSGVGQARDPREWLQPGDTVRVEITGLGVLENPVVAEE
jgi:2-keto-4-pentenoate hydratase/2-oxohepta-3-ene-1,7-dioic acid hydratase in catechol pathway